MREHGTTNLRGMTHVPLGQRGGGRRFGRMLFQLQADTPPDDFLLEIGKSGGIMDETEGDTEARDNSISAGMAFFGQFIDHDITLDTTPLTGQQNDPAAEENFRTPHLDLDSVYGAGPENEPHIYQQDDHAKFRIGTTDNPNDLPRDPATGIAFIPDERNDENLFISQLHLLFLKFHNKVVDYLREESDGPVGDEFEQARRIVQWHYQWIDLNEFLPLICESSIVDDVLDKGRKFFQI